jgi:hypothetical protein
MLGEQISVFNPNTKIRTVRNDQLSQDIDLEVKCYRPGSDGRSERWEAGEKLKLFAQEQINSWSGDQAPGDQALKESLLGELESGVAFQMIPHLIAMEPVLMLSNLDINQLKKIDTLLYFCEINSDRYNSAYVARSMVEGIILGRQIEQAKKSNYQSPAEIV